MTCSCQYSSTKKIWKGKVLHNKNCPMSKKEDYESIREYLEAGFSDEQAKLLNSKFKK